MNVKSCPKNNIETIQDPSFGVVGIGESEASKIGNDGDVHAKAAPLLNPYIETIKERQIKHKITMAWIVRIRVSS